ncbi:hypothetical protein HG535_0C04890 [Zygotorulaspora mrakii]|uniref:Uncharacterized protein n=1 Tax=Zygotorulaspora mrakii TaxID=42260 RepID=A0A7H9B0C0_ZYGMR|nr:uncharacterized protein HG535_0C04890 [Zygotorulaspora mrakii]QLG72135.1 hypothetical protein HG535_0C04890 [Zygotorulaspora mrakii]
MFDPLDLYTPQQNVFCGGEAEVAVDIPRETVSTDDVDEESNEDSLIDVLDLPSARHAPSKAILCVLLLLKPDNQVNFCSQHSSVEGTQIVSNICTEKGIEPCLLKTLMEFYKLWGNTRLNSESSICSKIPLLNGISKELMLNYYTTLLKFYQESSEDDLLKEEIVKQLTMRISERCGRSAQPAMSRKFTFEKLSKVIEIFEPSLTADNLGWKTWGSSFILSQKLIESIHTQRHGLKLRVLELGSGTGLAGISWLSKWIELNEGEVIEMFLTDLPEIVPNLQKNVEANALGSLATVSILDWTNTDSFEEKFTSEKFDVIIVSDPIYSPNHPKLVVDMLVKFLCDQGVCYLEIPVRDKYSKERETLWQLLELNNLSVRNQTLDQGMEDWGMVKYLYQEIYW